MVFNNFFRKFYFAAIQYSYCSHIEHTQNGVIAKAVIDKNYYQMTQFKSSSFYSAIIRNATMVINLL